MTTNEQQPNAELVRRREVLQALRQIIQSVDLHSRHLLREHGITGPQLVILQEVANFGAMTVSQLAKATSLSQGTVTNILMRLERGGLVTRTRSETDKRRVYIEITETCQELLASAPSPLHETFAERFGELAEWEQEMILSALKRLAAIMATESNEIRSRNASKKGAAVHHSGKINGGSGERGEFRTPSDPLKNPST